jgi:hypothetical protein
LRLHSFQNDGVKVGSDGTIHNAKAIVEKIGPLCDYIMFDEATLVRASPRIARVPLTLKQPEACPTVALMRLQEHFH